MHDGKRSTDTNTKRNGQTSSDDAALSRFGLVPPCIMIQQTVGRFRQPVCLDRAWFVSACFSPIPTWKAPLIILINLISQWLEMIRRGMAWAYVFILSLLMRRCCSIESTTRGRRLYQAPIGADKRNNPNRGVWTSSHKVTSQSNIMQQHHESAFATSPASRLCKESIPKMGSWKKFMPKRLHGEHQVTHQLAWLYIRAVKEISDTLLQVRRKTFRGEPYAWSYGEKRGRREREGEMPWRNYIGRHQGLNPYSLFYCAAVLSLCKILFHCAAIIESTLCN